MIPNSYPGDGIFSLHLTTIKVSLGVTKCNIKTILSPETKSNEPRHKKTNKMSVRPAKTQISLGIRPVWSESSLSAWRKLGSLATHWACSEDWSDWADAQADLSLRWVHTHFVGFVMSRLKFCNFPGMAKNSFNGAHVIKFWWSYLAIIKQLNCWKMFACILKALQNNNSVYWTRPIDKRLINLIQLIIQKIVEKKVDTKIF